MAGHDPTRGSGHAAAPSLRERRTLAVARGAAAVTAIGGLVSPPLANAGAVVLLLAFLLLPSAATRLRTAASLPLVRAALAVLAVLALAMLWADAPVMLRLKYWADWRVLMLLILCLPLFDDQAARRRALLAFIAVASAGALFSFWAWSQGVFVIPHHHGLPGTVLRNPVTQAMGFAVACFLSLVLLFGDRGLDRRLRLPLVAAAAVLAANLAFVASGRTGHLLLLIMLGGVALQLLAGWRRLAVIVALPLVAALALAVSPVLQTRFGMMMSELRNPLGSEQISGMGIRVVMWRVSAELALQRPLLGYGTGGFPAAYAKAIKATDYDGWAATPTIDPHNQYLLVQTQAGLLGSAAFLWFLVAGFRSRGPEPWRAAGRSMLLGWCASALATSVFTAFAESHIFWPLLGILLAPAAPAATAGVRALGGPPLQGSESVLRAT